MSSFIELPRDDSEEVVEMPVVQFTADEQAQTERIDSFMKEIAEIHASPKSVEKNWWDRDIERMKKTAEKQKMHDVGYPVKTVKAGEEISVEKISDNVFVHPVRAVEIKPKSCHATREEALSEGSLKKDEIFARLDEDKHLPRGREQESEKISSQRLDTVLKEVKAVTDSILEEAGMKPMNSQRTKFVAVSAEEEKIRLKDELRREYLRDGVRDTKILQNDVNKTIEKRAELQILKDKAIRGEVPVVEQESIDNKKQKYEDHVLAEKELDIAVFGSYKIKHQIDSGSHGVLYEGVAEITGRKVVLKTESEENGASLEERTKNSIGEATINNEVNHENIMPIENVVKDADGRVYLVMPFIKGAKKAELADKRTQKQIAEIGKLLADALSAVHKKGIIHRDIKPENTLIDQKGKPILLDFGIAKVDEKINPDLANSLTGTRFIDDKTAGSIRYMAPEVLEGWEKASEQSDIYSLGKMLYRMALQSKEALPIGDVKQQLKDKGIEEKLADCITKSVADKVHRYKTAEELAHDLARILEVKVPEEDVIDFEGAIKTAKEFDTQKLEEKVDAGSVLTAKTEKLVSERFESKVYRGLNSLTREEFIMTTANYFVYLNNILASFKTSLKIGDVEAICLELKTAGGKKRVVMHSLKALVENYNNSWELESRIVIPFSSHDEQISGSVQYHAGNFYGKIAIKHEENDTGLSKVLAYFSYKFGRKLWGSPAKELQKKGFSLERALYILKTQELYEHYAKIFVRATHLYTVDGKYIGKLGGVYSCHRGLNEWWERSDFPSKINDWDVSKARFYHGHLFKKNTEYARYEFIDIGDCFVLRPNAELPEWVK